MTNLLTLTGLLLTLCPLATASDVEASFALEPSIVTTGELATFRFELDNSSVHVIEDVEISLDFIDASGASVPSLFLLGAPIVSGITAVDGSANLPPGQVATAGIPVSALALATPGPESVRYRVTGTLTGRIEGTLVTRTLPPQGLEIFPGATLEVELYSPNSVYADWAGTTGLLEPSEPFAVGLVVRNTGAGAATNLSLLSSGPRFVADPGGLPLVAAITEIELNNAPIEGGYNLGPSQLGDLAPGAELRILWSLEGNRKATLSGFDLEIVHQNPVGGIVIAKPLVESADALVHAMLAVEMSGGLMDDGAVDFVVEDPLIMAPIDPVTTLPFEDFPGLIRTSTGTDLVLTGIVNAMLGAAPSASNLTTSAGITTAAPGWHYTRFDSPAGHTFELAQVSRTTMGMQFRGFEVGGAGDVSEVWTTERPVDLTADGIPDFIRREIHIVDFVATAGSHQYNLTFQETANFALTADVEFVPAATGGTQNLSLDAGIAHAGEIYLVLGSLSGTSPGTPVNNQVLPLNVDQWFINLLTNPTLQTVLGTAGVLDATGQGSANILIPSGAFVGIGVAAHHAFLTVPAVGPIDFVSNAVPLFILP
ncbi:MAG: hypothetical protein ACI9D0_001531 [Bacteroidia bacterium]|jgi:hypothetical protein